VRSKWSGRTESGGAIDRPGDDVKTTRERAEEKRVAKLAHVQEQVESGSLVIRQMTPEERRQYPALPVAKKRAWTR
jgi:hypothetical protein